ncbi:hypothetical protein [Burkholderia pseudomallei]|uniref:hypothetical protein n=1 Tax=Burkholderia pseudomallei TaxID=28450 RepID=UPI0012B2260F|nr:hypothetical protein [Burkholderia pseudomallei]
MRSPDSGCFDGKPRQRAMLGRDADRDASSRRAARRLREMLRESAGPGPDANRRRPASRQAAPPRLTDDRPTRGDRRPATGAPGSPGSTGSTAGAKAAARRPAAFDR